uniref:Polyprotein allergen nematode domain-containing protein n=1 Tax=Panagrolaimus sp. ES5 TaxID=591445 RepID=A0AC34GJS2_9BILA
MRESGASNEALMAKTEELLATVEDETLRKEADEHKEDCLKVFGIKSRKIRDCGFDTEKHLTWLTDEQKDILTQMKAEKKAPQDIHKKIFEFYDTTTGETRTKAKELMQGGCKDVLKHVLGEEKTAELKAMKESGASNDEMSSKIKDMMDEIDDKEKKSYAVAYEGPCKRIFGVGSRKRRDHHHGHKLEDYLKTHLSWLTSEQGETLKTMKADGKTPSEL